MAGCDAAHAQFDGKVGGPLETGTLPEWTRVRGKVIWRAVRGPYDRMAGDWKEFMEAAMAALRGPPDGPCGDVYLCNPTEHGPERFLTILYLPVR
jgi:hypothetical protein